MSSATKSSRLEMLEARYYLYTALQILLGETPTAERLKAVDVDLAEDALKVLGIDCEASAIKRLKRAMGDIDAAKSAYTRLFLGPNVLPVPMWESVYLSDENALFTKDTLSVRSFYRENGVLPKLYPRVADDHISFELGFMALLSKQMVEACTGREEERYLECKETSREFLEGHLGKWIARWSDAMGKAADSELYASVACIAADLVNNDIELFKKEA